MGQIQQGAVVWLHPTFRLDHTVRASGEFLQVPKAHKNPPHFHSVLKGMSHPLHFPLLCLLLLLLSLLSWGGGSFRAILTSLPRLYGGSGPPGPIKRDMTKMMIE